MFLAAILTACGGLMFGVVSRSNDIRAAWGPTTEVITVRANHPPGGRLESSDFRLVEIPSVFAGDDALRDVPQEADTTVRALRPGDIVTNRDLRSRRPTLDLPAGHRALSLPLDATVPALVPGDLVDLYVISNPFGELDPRAERLDPPSTVVELTEHALVLGVHERNVEAVVRAASSGRVTVALR